jgi:hypothetical protein
MSTLVEESEADEGLLLALGREELLARARWLLLLLPEEPVETIPNEKLVEALLEVYGEDLASAREARRDALASELACRGVSACGDFTQLSERLRQQVIAAADDGTRCHRPDCSGLTADRVSCAWRALCTTRNRTKSAN